MRRLIMPLVSALLALASLCVLPHRLCEGKARTFYRGEAEATRQLGSHVDAAVEKLALSRFSTGSARFDGEWYFGTGMMAALGFGQTARAHPELAPEALDRMDRALDTMLGPRARAFDRDAWGSDALESLDSDQGHAAYLGYANLALSLRRFVAPGSRFDELGDRVSAALERRMNRARGAALETYPGEIYPVDNAAVAASLGLRARARGEPEPAAVRAFLRALRQRYVDPKSGLLHQSVGAERLPADAPRGSGTALAAYFLSFTDEESSRALHRAVRRELAGDVLGFGVVREYPHSFSGRRGDIDSGPLIFGYSISAMGFGLAGCRVHGDEDGFRELYRSFHLFGAPLERNDSLAFASGGPLGNAIVFAMLTALPAEHWRRA